MRKRYILAIFLICFIGLSFCINSNALLVKFIPYDAYAYNNGFIDEYASTENQNRIVFNDYQKRIDIGNGERNSGYSFTQIYLDFSLMKYSQFLSNGQQDLLVDVYTKSTTDSIYIRYYINFYNDRIEIPIYYNPLGNEKITIYFAEHNIDIENSRNLEIQIHTKMLGVYPNQHSATKIQFIVDNTPKYVYIDDNLVSYGSTYNMIKVFLVKVYSITNTARLTFVKGLRAYYYNEFVVLETYFDFPLFWSDVPYKPVEETPSKYWSYPSFKLEVDYTDEIELQETVSFLNDDLDVDFSYDYDILKGVSYTAKFYYTLEFIKREKLGDWGINNWIRNLLVGLMNAVMFLVQFLLYILVLGLNVLFISWIIMLLVPFFWNIVIYWIVFAFMFIVFWLFIGLLFLVDLLVKFFQWLFFDIIVPTFIWVVEVLFPLIIDIIILILSWLIAILIYMIALGNVDIFEIQGIVNSFLTTISDFIIETTILIITYLPEMFLYIAFYFILIGFLFLKLAYVKARGFVNRSCQLQSSLDAYMLPIHIGVGIIVRIKEIVANWI